MGDSILTPRISARFREKGMPPSKACKDDYLKEGVSREVFNYYRRNVIKNLHKRFQASPVLRERKRAAVVYSSWEEGEEEEGAGSGGGGGEAFRPITDGSRFVGTRDHEGGKPQPTRPQPPRSTQRNEDSRDKSLFRKSTHLPHPCQYHDSPMFVETRGSGKCRKGWRPCGGSGAARDEEDCSGLDSLESDWERRRRRWSGGSRRRRRVPTEDKASQTPRLPPRRLIYVFIPPNRQEEKRKGEPRGRTPTHPPTARQPNKEVLRKGLRAWKSVRSAFEKAVVSLSSTIPPPAAPEGWAKWQRRKRGRRQQGAVSTPPPDHDRSTRAAKVLNGR